MDRPEQIRALRRQGVSVRDICERLGISRQTVWRCSKGIEPDTPTPHTPDANGHTPPLDLAAARALGLGVLVERASAGSVSAAAHVFKTASAELRANRCKDHVAAADVISSLKTQYHLWILALKGSFQRRLLMEYENLDQGHLESLVDDAIDGVTRELNTRFGASEEGEHG